MFKAISNQLKEKSWKANNNFLLYCNFITYMINYTLFLFLQERTGELLYMLDSMRLSPVRNFIGKEFSYFFIVVSIFFSLTGSSFAGGKEYIQGKIDNLVKDSYLEGGKFSLYIKVLKRGDIIYDYNSSLSLAPASNMKVLTTAAALSKLGSNFSFDTNVYGKVQNDTITSDLILYSNGDPTYCVEFYKPPTKVFRSIAQKLYSMGIRTVKGDVLGDDSFFDRQLRGKGWKEEYQFEAYSAEVSPLSLNENVIDLKVSPGKDYYLPGIVTIFPYAGIIEVINQTKTSETTQSISVERLKDSNKIIVSGWIPYDYSCVETYVNVHNPALYTTSAFARILKEEGIKLNGTVRLIGIPAEIRKKDVCGLLCVHKSPPLPAVISYINKKSDNLSAEMLLKTLGGVTFGQGSAENGSSVVKDFLREVGVDTSGLVMADGSGLSPEDRVTSKLLVDVLSYMYFSPDGKAFVDSFSMAGVDGTLRKRLRGTPAEGNLKGKTGTISGVSALCGYVSTSYGQTIVFSILSNDIPEGAAKDAEDRIVQILASCPEEI
ncbi:MAG: D-alanyl-D-alanine carboxypeptidase DacC precursor [bacterium ADurb.Bin363]|nr:MAG: D-alanyl-D-alanine carboxypeptidase DacC precursor [bacterium ADurb.Bin363]